MKAITIKIDGKPIMICEVKEYNDLDFLKMKKECDKNLAELKEEKIQELADIYHELDFIKDDIKILKGEE